MKFTDGQWLFQPGVSAHYPAEAHDITLSEDARQLVVHAPTRPIRHRGDTLQGPLLTITLSSPLEGVIRVRVDHFTNGGQAGPVIPLQTGDDARALRLVGVCVVLAFGLLWISEHLIRRRTAP